MQTTMTRRAWLGALGGAAVVSALPRPAQAAVPERKRVLRLAHLTDVHVQPGPGEGGFAQALHHLQSLADPVELILNGGDAIMDSFGHVEADVARMWACWQTILQRETHLPVQSCLGNHDCWGGNLKASKTTGTEPRWGKQWACEIHGLTKPYHSFDRAGWHFIVLDSTFVANNGYIAKLDDAQFEWLKGDLAATPKTTPVLVLSHEPILSVCALFDGANESTASPEWRIPGGWMHVDARRIKEAFRAHGNVRVALSGHIHLIDSVTYNNTSYYCNGAVSGNWWNVGHPAYQEAEPGYATLDLYDDGSSERQFHVYGWKPNG